VNEVLRRGIVYLLVTSLVYPEVALALPNRDRETPPVPRTSDASAPRLEEGTSTVPPPGAVAPRDGRDAKNGAARRSVLRRGEVLASALPIPGVVRARNLPPDSDTSIPDVARPEPPGLIPLEQQGTGLPITIGQVVNGSITAAGETDTFEFDAGFAGQSVTLDKTSVPAVANVNWTLADAWGRVLLSSANSSLEDVGAVALMGGHYVVSIFGLPAFSGAVNYSFRVVDATPLDLACSIGTLVTSSVSVPGQAHLYTFTSPANQLVYFDSRTAYGAWSLTDSRGQALFSAGMADRGPLRLMGGTYELRLAPSGTTPTTGNYQFLISDATPSEQTLTVGTPVSGTISNPGSEIRYSFTANANQIILIDRTSPTDPGLRWRLTDSQGRVFLNLPSGTTNNLSDQGPVALVGGAYTLAVTSAVGGATGSYAFQVLDQGTASPPAPGNPVTVDTPVSGSIGTPGGEERYTFNVASPGRYFFDIGNSGTVNLAWELLDSAGQRVFVNGPWPFLADQGPFGLAAGTYVLRCYATTGTATPVVEFTIRSVTDTTASASLDQLISGSFAGAGARGSTQTYVITVPQQQVAYVEVATQFVCQMDWALLDPVGEAIIPFAGQSCGPQGELRRVLAAGTYSLVLDSLGDLQPVFTARVWSVQDEAGSTTLNFAHTGQLATPGAISTTTLTVTDGQEVICDLGSGAIGLGWSLRDPVGVPLFSAVSAQNPTTGDRGPFVLAAGTYTFTVDGNAALVTTFSFAARNPGAGFAVTTGAVTLTTTATQATYDVPLTTPVTIDAMRYALIEALDVTFTKPLNPSQVTVDYRVRLLSAGDEILEFPVQGIVAGGFNVPGHWYLRFSGSILPELTPARPTIAIDGLRILINQPAGATTSLASIHSDQRLRVHFVSCGFEPCGPHVQRTVSNLPSLVFSSTGPSAWQDVAFEEPVPGEALRLVSGPAFSALRQGDIHTGVTSQAQLTLDNGQHVTLGDWAPSSSLAEPPWDSLSYSHSLALSGHELAGRTITGFRWRIYNTGSPTSTYTPPNPLVISFLYELTDCPVGFAVDPNAFDPADGSSVRAGSQIVLSGRVQLPSYGEPPTAVLVNDEPVESLDATGAFFKKVSVDAGANPFTVAVLPASCGETSTTVTLNGVTEEQSIFDNLSDITTAISARYTNTTFDRVTETFQFEVAACNQGNTSIRGPLQMIFTRTNHPSVVVATPEGFTTDGKPFILLTDLGTDDRLAPGQCSAPKRVALLNPERAHVEFEIVWKGPVDRAPYFQSVPGTTSTIGASYRYAASAVDPEGDPVSYALARAPEGMTIGTVTGVIDWTPLVADVGGHEVVVEASDGYGGTARQRFTLQVRDGSVNQAPYFTTTPPTRAAVGARYSYDAEVLEPDGDAVTFTLANGPSGALIDSVTGALTWDFALLGSYPVEVRAEDGRGGRATQRYTLVVGTPMTNPTIPRLYGSPAAVAAVDRLYFYQPALDNPDVSETVTFTLPTAPSGMTIDATTGRVEWTPTTAQVGTHMVELQADDGNGGFASQLWSVDVYAELPNRPPVVVSSPTFEAVLDEVYSYAVQAVDPDRDPVSFSLVSPPAGMSIDPLTGELTWTPTTVGSATVAIRVADPSGAFGAQVYTLDAVPPNNDPQITTTPPGAHAFVGRAYQYDVNAIDADGHSLLYAFGQGPSGMEIREDLGIISWTPSASQVGTHPVIATVSDGHGGLATQAFNVIVDADAVAPTVKVNLSAPQVLIRSQMQVCLEATDDIGLVSRTLLVNSMPATMDYLGCTILEYDAPQTVSVRGEATDAMGNLGFENVAFDVVDPDNGTRPTVTLISPAIDSKISAPTEIYATITDDTPGFLTWEVRIARAGTDDFTVIGSGSGEVTNAVVATFDPTLLPNDAYRVQIEGSDGALTGGIEFLYSVFGELKLGNFEITFTDLVIPLAGIPIVITRSYNSLDTSPGDFGAGWRLGVQGQVTDSATEVGYDDDLTTVVRNSPFTRTTRVYVDTLDGRRVGFTFDPQPVSGYGYSLARPSFHPDPGVTDKLEAVSPAGSTYLWDRGGTFYEFVVPYNPHRYVLTTSNGTEYHLDESSGALFVQDSHDNRLTFSSSGITSSFGPSILFDRDINGRIMRITEPENSDPANPPRQLEYGYDANGDLVLFRDQLGRDTLYEYNSLHAHLLTTITDPLNRPIVRNVFDDAGRLIAQCNPTGDVATLAGCATFTADPFATFQTLIDPAGARTDIVLNERADVLMVRRWLDAATWFDDQYSYDAAGNLVTAVGPAGESLTFTYDERGNVTSLTDNSETTHVAYNACDRPTSITDHVGDTMAFAYDESGCHLQSIAAADGSQVSYVRNALGQVTDFYDTTGNHWSWEYDARGFPHRITNPTGDTSILQFNSLGNIVAQTDFRGRQVSLTYDAAHRLTRESWDTSPSSEIIYTYDDAGQLTVVSDNYAEVRLSYDARGLLQQTETTLTDFNDPLVVTYAHDSAGNVVGVDDSIGGLTRYTFDALGRLTKATQSGSAVPEKRVELQYDAAGLLLEIERFDQLVGGQLLGRSTFEYACAGCGSRIQRVSHQLPNGAPLHVIDLDRDAKGNLTRVTDAEGEHEHTYDARNQLVAVDHSAVIQPDEYYTYDAAGNRESSHLSQVYTYSEGANRLTANAEYEFTYDQNGNLVERLNLIDGERADYLFDHRNRLVRAQHYSASNELVGESLYTYDALNRRVAVMERGTRTVYLYDGSNAIVTVGEDGTVRSRKFYTPAVDGIVADDVSGASRWLLRDHVGSVRDLMGTDGRIVQHYIYDSFGRLLDRSSVETPDELTFGAREFSNVTGLGYFRSRYYDPTIGRFISEDPVGFAGGDDNLYRFAANSPSQYVDPTGITVFEYESINARIAVVEREIIQCLGETALTNFVEQGVYLLITKVSSNTFGLDTNAYAGKTKQTFRARVSQHVKGGKKVIAYIGIGLDSSVVNSPAKLAMVEQMLYEGFGGTVELLNKVKPSATNLKDLKKVLCLK